jgi:hypothetical protein
MITLSILCIILGIISYFKIKKACKQKEIEFDPFEGSFINYLGFVLGLAMFIIDIIAFSIYYLP